MSEWLSAFHFLRPWWLLLALAWVPLAVFLWRADRDGARWRRLADAALLPHLLEGSGKARHMGAWLLAAACALTTLALAGPTWERLPRPLYGKGAAQVVAVSLSRRMLAGDVTPDRMQRVRYKVHDLLHANAGGRNGLVAYAGEAFVVAPLTTDAHALDDLLDALSPQVMPVHGDAPAKGIRQGVALLEQAGMHGGSLVLVTDKVDAAAVDAARRARAKGVRVSVLGVGGTRGVPVTLPDGSLLKDAAGHVVMARQDARSLRALAAAGGGIYVPMSDDRADIEALAGQLRAGHRPAAAASGQADQWRDMGPWLLLPVLLLAALAFRRGWLLVLALACLPCIAPPARAAEAAPAPAASVAGKGSRASAPSWHDRWSAWWLNPDQRAARALAAGQPGKAQRLAQSPGLRGTAAYRAGDYAGAARAFARAPGADAAYNLGNALAREGRYKDAIAAYDKALELRPGMADARANRKAVEDWLQRHRRKSASPQGGKKPRAGKSQGQGSSKQGRQGGTSKHPGTGRPSPARAGRQPSPSHSAPAPARAASRAPAPASTAPKPAPAGSTSAPAPAGSLGRPSGKQAAPDVKSAQARQDEVRAARRALQRQLGKTGHKQEPVRHGQPFELGRVPAHAASVDSLPEPMERALQRVADDPGGLLKRKFELEYRKRHGGGP